VTDLRRQLADHLRFFEEMGVTGVSNDPRWRNVATASNESRTSHFAPRSSDLAPRSSDLASRTSDLHTPVAISRSAADVLAAVKS
jgi:hypothetical protein